MAETPGKKTKNQTWVKVVPNTDSEGYACGQCAHNLDNYLAAKNMELMPNGPVPFYVPLEWWLANEKLGCPHGKQKLLKSAYV